MSVPTLFDCLAAIPDARSRHGVRHPLSAILSMVVLAILMGRTSLAGVARFGRQFGPKLAFALGFRRGLTPSPSTLSRTLAALDPVAVEDALARWVADRLDPAALGHISLDGETLRGSRDGEVPAVHLLAAYAPHAQAVLAQVRVDATTNEHKAALQLLGVLPLRGRVVVGDAAFGQRDLAERVVQSGGDYVLMVKGNQEGLRGDVAGGFAFEDTARGIAAATSPCERPAAGTGPESMRQGRRHGARAGRTPDRANHPHSDGGREVAGVEAGGRVAA